jgi:hypothetical protein
MRVYKQLTAQQIGLANRPRPLCNCPPLLQRRCVPLLLQLGDFGKIVASNGGDHPPLFNGYYYRIGTPGNAPGSFAVLVYPAKYQKSGIMTFIAGKDGVIYQKDLGEKTGEVAVAMDRTYPGRRLERGCAAHRQRIAPSAVRRRATAH